MAKRLPSLQHADTLSVKALRGLVTDLLERSQPAEGRLAKLEAETIQLREERAALGLENNRLKVENQLLRDEIARLNNLPLSPPFRSSGMDKATDAAIDAQPARISNRGRFGGEVWFGFDGYVHKGVYLTGSGLSCHHLVIALKGHEPVPR